MGFFSRKPSKQDQERLLAVSQRALPIFIRLAKSRSVKFNDGRIVDLNDAIQCAELNSAVLQVLDELRLADRPPNTIDAMVERTQLVHQRLNSSDYETIGPVREAAQQIVLGLNAHELLCFNYYEMYPDFEPL